MNNKIATSVKIGLAYLGVAIGAGFASGQEMMQYYVSFGSGAFWGILLSGILFLLSSMALLGLGSYFQATEHAEVFDQITTPLVSKVVDWSITLTLFILGFVMIAGGGTNLNQQFGLPIWMGAVLVAALTIATSFLDVDKVSNVIGAITPFIILMIALGGIYSAFVQKTSLNDAIALTQQVKLGTLPNWFISSVNYVGLQMMTAVSMAVVMGGNEYNPRQATAGGFIGGLLIDVMMVLCYLALAFNLSTIYQSDMPLLEVFNEIHPWLGTFMSVVIFGMILNTAIGVYYALGKRISSKKPEQFQMRMTIVVLIGFVLSFAGFKTLVGYTYPIIGYVGIAVLALVVVKWCLRRSAITREIRLRELVLDFFVKKNDDEVHYSRREAKRANQLIEESNSDNERLEDKVEEVSQEIVNNDDYNWEDYREERADEHLKTVQQLKEEDNKLKDEEENN